MSNSANLFCIALTATGLAFCAMWICRSIDRSDSLTQKRKARGKLAVRLVSVPMLLLLVASALAP
jgi:hypothetical protein